MDLSIRTQRRTAATWSYAQIVPTYDALPPNLPVPHDDGAADHLVGVRLLDLSLPSTGDHALNPSSLPGRIVIYVYPMTGRPGVALPDARASSVVGLSGQPTDYQEEVVARLHLPYRLLSDGDFAWTECLQLPTFLAEGQRFHSRLTMIVNDGVIEHVFYPVFPPDTHAADVLTWLLRNNA
ncbi:MAG: redoxin family protein [Actinomycetia bacterium]|nr:redoxin family protein [Actinomycetes bacterium]